MNVFEPKPKNTVKNTKILVISEKIYQKPQ